MHSHRLSTLLVATIVSGCASASGSTGAETPAPTRPPVLVDCADFNSPETLVAFALGLTLFVITLALNVLALYIVRRYREQYE